MSIEKVKSDKAPKGTGFTQIFNDVIDAIPGASSLGIYIYLLSKPTDWGICKEEIKKHFGIGRDKLDSCLAELKKVGLVDIQRERCQRGWFRDSIIHVKAGYHLLRKNLNTENPCLGKTIQNTGNPDAGYPVSGNQQLQKKEIKRKEKNKKKECQLVDKFSVDNFIVTDEQKSRCIEHGINYLDVLQKFIIAYKCQRMGQNLWIKQFDLWIAAWIKNAKS